MPDQKNISLQIKNIREKYNMSQSRFGLKIGLSGKTISAYENGKCTPPLKILEKISVVYGESFLQLKKEKQDDLYQRIQNIKDAINEIEDLLNKSLSY